MLVTQTVTTQQAAELLGISRPTVIRVLDEGRLLYEKIGSHRRIELRDLLTYRDERRAAQYAALEASAIDDDDVDGALRQMPTRALVAIRAIAVRSGRCGQRLTTTGVLDLLVDRYGMGQVAELVCPLVSPG